MKILTKAKDLTFVLTLVKKIGAFWYVCGKGCGCKNGKKKIIDFYKLFVKTK